MSIRSLKSDDKLKKRSKKLFQIFLNDLETRFQANCNPDTSKVSLDKRKQKLYLECLIKEKNRIIGRSEIRKMHENLIIIKQKPVSKTEKLQAKNKAAIKIQKFVKGWLTRKKHF